MNACTSQKKREDGAMRGGAEMTETRPRGKGGERSVRHLESCVGLPAIRGADVDDDPPPERAVYARSVGGSGLTRFER